MTSKIIKALIVTGVVGATAMASPAFAGDPATDGQKKYKTIGGGVGEAIKLTATVVGIDAVNRSVSLKGPEGNVVNVQMPEEAKNFGQIAVGDKVDAVYYESVALFLGQPGEKPEVKETIAKEGAAAGLTPAGLAARSVDVSATIQAIDKANRKVTLKAPDGSVKTIAVPADLKLDKIKAGDVVHARYTQALALELKKT